MTDARTKYAHAANEVNPYLLYFVRKVAKEKFQKFPGRKFV